MQVQSFPYELKVRDIDSTKCMVPHFSSDSSPGVHMLSNRGVKLKMAHQQQFTLAVCLRIAVPGWMRFSCKTVEKSGQLAIYSGSDGSLCVMINYWSLICSHSVLFIERTKPVSKRNTSFAFCTLNLMCAKDSSHLLFLHFIQASAIAH